MRKDVYKDKVARGATLSAKLGPRSASLKLVKQVRTKSKIKKKYGTQPIILRGKDLENLDPVLSFLRKSGVAVTAYKRGYLIRRTRARIGRLGLDTYVEYLQYLRNNSKEIQLLHDTLSINVTRFFRNEDTFSYIRDNVIPDLVKVLSSSPTTKIKIWSAGCAVGPEPYSIAMLCSDSKELKNKVAINASDINRNLLEIAQNGVYSPQYLAEMTKEEASRYFILDHNQNYMVKPSIKKLVKFDQTDLIKDRYPSNCDMIICRNVLIYLDSSMQKIILEKFFQSLKVGGILILGRTETLQGTWKKSYEVKSSTHRVYIKI
ncbi:MAG: protein-glutamate O-methyltransferase CheR [Candidatus Heimdallarchaeota archaeon]|nr:protein-glutamate O-methyltransferase CheR [Candidatus Heimdallarchaeota archaeon]